MPDTQRSTIPPAVRKEYYNMLAERAEAMDMHRSEMIVFLKNHPYIRITHPLFSTEEYIYSNDTGDVYDENGYLFEDWRSEGPARHDGLRSRAGDAWETGWKLCASYLPGQDSQETL